MANDASAANRGRPHRARVTIVHGHPLVGDALALALTVNGLDATAAPPMPADTLTGRLLATPTDLHVLDLETEVVGEDCARVGTLAGAGRRVLLMIGTTDIEPLARAVERGAVGMVSKAAPFARFVDAVTAATTGKQLMTQAQRGRLLAAARDRRALRAARLAPFDALTPREQDVLHELGEGRTVTAIARTHQVSESTVRTHVHGILAKLGVGSQLEAVVAARRCGWM